MFTSSIKIVPWLISYILKRQEKSEDFPLPVLPKTPIFSPGSSCLWNNIKNLTIKNKFKLINSLKD